MLSSEPDDEPDKQHVIMFANGQCHGNLLAVEQVKSLVQVLLQGTAKNVVMSWLEA